MEPLSREAQIIGKIYDLALEEEDLVSIFIFLLGDNYTITKKPTVLQKEQITTILKYVASRQYINAIKAYREFTGSGLQEAKAYIDSIQE